jgi:hypothetical protein
MKASKAKLSRRNFLLAVSAGSAATAAAIVAKKSAGTDPSKDKSSESGKGYQLTEHVQNYYRTAKI